MKIKIIILCITFISFIQGQQQLKLKLTLDKTTYYVSEPIFLSRSFINTTVKPIPLYYISLEHLFIKDEKGNLFYPIVRFFSANHTIVPGDSFFFVNELVMYYGNPWLESENDIYGFPVGTYTIQLKYQNRKVQIISNKLIFHIIEPVGEEKEAFNLYTKMRYLFLSKKKQDFNSIFNIGNQLIRKYPKSVYVPPALILLNVKEKGRFNKYLKQLLFEYPNSRMASISLRGLLNSYNIYNQNDKEFLVNLLKEIIRKHPFSLTAIEAKKQLKKIH